MTARADGTALADRGVRHPAVHPLHQLAYDLEAHLAKKGTTAWVGYKVHLTETCDEDSPRLITNVETSAAPTADGALTPEIHDAPKREGAPAGAA